MNDPRHATPQVPAAAAHAPATPHAPHGTHASPARGPVGGPTTGAGIVDGPANPVAGTIVLKKYGNRRLYDTSASHYVTLVEVEQMVQRGADIVVLDAKTGDDITKEILVQLLLERDEARAALPVGLLKQAVRLAGTPLKDNLARVMQEGLDAFLGSQRAVADAQRAFSAQVAQMTQMGPLGGAPWNPSAVPTLWNPFASLTPPPPRHGDVASANAPSSSSQPQQAAPASTQAQQLDALKAELTETQTLVKRLLERELADEGRSARGARAPRSTKAAKNAKTPKSTKTRRR
jgi:polyhydroxyalkanoate synthesis repressor PhaR